MNRGIVCLLGALFVAQTADADMVDTSEMKTWEHCALCHGHDGISRTAKFPKLAAQTEAYMIKQLIDFSENRRHNDGGMMNGGAASQFPLEKLREAARHYSRQQPPPPATTEASAEIVARGRMIFEKGLSAQGVPACKSCHGAAAAASLGRPRLESQHVRYLKKQLGDFRNGARANDPDGPMRGIAGRLSDADIEAVTVYLSQTPRGAP